MTDERIEGKYSREITKIFRVIFLMLLHEVFYKRPSSSFEENHVGHLDVLSSMHCGQRSMEIRTPPPGSIKSLDFEWNIRS
jgi:hypothetical protein